jgi:hypothetical protein
LQIAPCVIPDTTSRPTSGQTACVSPLLLALLRLPVPAPAPAARRRALLRLPVAAICSTSHRRAPLHLLSPRRARLHLPATLSTSKRWTFRSNPASARPVPAAARADAPNPASNPPPTPDEVLPSTKMLRQGSSTPLARGDHRSHAPSSAAEELPRFHSSSAIAVSPCPCPASKSSCSSSKLHQTIPFLSYFSGATFSDWMISLGVIKFILQI